MALMGHDNSEEIEVSLADAVLVTSVSSGQAPGVTSEGRPCLGLALGGPMFDAPQEDQYEIKFVLRLACVASVIAQLLWRAEEAGLGNALAAEIDQAKAAYRLAESGGDPHAPLTVPDSPAGLLDTPNDAPGDE